MKPLLSIWLCTLAIATWGQDLESLRAAGHANLQAGNFWPALHAYLQYQEARPGQGDILTGIGACYLELCQLDNAKDFLLRAVQAQYTPPDAYRYLGQLAHAHLRFEEAADHYKSFLQKTSTDDTLRAAVKDDLLRCATGLRVRRQLPQGVVVELGEPVNSPGDEFRPLLPPGNTERLYFSYAQPKLEGLEQVRSDLYFTELQHGKWQQPRPLSIFLNSAANEVPQGFDEQGRQLFFFRGKTLFSGDILVDTLRENQVEGTLFLSEFESPMQAWEGDRDLFFFNDTIILFASRRRGGYGGLDLYVCTKHPDGWSVPQNLGPVINSAYDETSPFLAPDGRTLFFSTNDARRSIGGADVLRSVYLDRAHRWIPPENLGSPFNSAADDEHFFLSPDGKRAFFSSARKSGQGQRDLYTGIFSKTTSSQPSRSEPVAFHLVPPSEGAAPANAPAPARPDGGASLLLSPLRFPAPNQPLAEASFAKLDELARWMLEYPELRITFAAHTAPADERSAGRSALQQVLETLRGQGVPMGNVALRNLGPAFPLPGNDPADQRRIDLLLANPEVLPVPVQVPELASSKARFFQQAMGRLIFQVTVPLDEASPLGDLLASYPDGTVLELPATGQRFFAAGIYLTWGSARQAQATFRDNGLPQAAAVPYLSGWPLSKTEAAALAAAFPELQGFVAE